MRQKIILYESDLLFSVDETSLHKIQILGTTLYLILIAYSCSANYLLSRYSTTIFDCRRGITFLFSHVGLVSLVTGKYNNNGTWLHGWRGGFLRIFTVAFDRLFRLGQVK